MLCGHPPPLRPPAGSHRLHRPKSAVTVGMTLVCSNAPTAGAAAVYFWDKSAHERRGVVVRLTRDLWRKDPCDAECVRPFVPVVVVVLGGW